MNKTSLSSAPPGSNGHAINVGWNRSNSHSVSERGSLPANMENRRFKVVVAAVTQLHLLNNSFLNVLWPVLFLLLLLVLMRAEVTSKTCLELPPREKAGGDGSSSLSQVTSSLQSNEPLRAGAHVGAPWRAGDSCPRGCGGGRPLTALCRCCSFSFFLILKNSLCWRETKLTAAYSSSAANTKSRHTAIQMSMAFT